ncbi:hypothetical protein R6Q59_009031 [Mikania micrantha]
MRRGKSVAVDVEDGKRKRGSLSSSSSRSKRRSRPPKWSEYEKNQMILIVGDGDFSFLNSMAHALGDGRNITATSFDSYNTLLLKYKKAKKHINNLQELGARIIHNVDATKMKTLPCFANMRFDIIIFNIPHAGFSYGKDKGKRAQEANRELVRGFFTQASMMLAEQGHVQVTHKISSPFSDWSITTLAKEEGLVKIKEEWFNIQDYPGYVNKKGDGRSPDESFAYAKCKKYRFGRV